MTIRDIENIASENGWAIVWENIDCDQDTFEDSLSANGMVWFDVIFVGYSPADENITFAITASTMNELIGNVEGHASDFNIEDHVRQILNEKEDGMAYYRYNSSSVPDVFRIVEDAKAIKEKLTSLAVALTEKRDENVSYEDDEEVYDHV